jgi:hypothetical protein
MFIKLESCEIFECSIISRNFSAITFISCGALSRIKPQILRRPTDVHIGVAQIGAQGISYHHENPITCDMSIPIIDILEVINIDKKQAMLQILILHLNVRAVELYSQIAAITKPCKRVEEYLCFQNFDAPQRPGNFLVVAENLHGSNDLGSFIYYGGCAHEYGQTMSVGMA